MRCWVWAVEADLEEEDAAGALAAEVVVDAGGEEETDEDVKSENQRGKNVL